MINTKNVYHKALKWQENGPIIILENIRQTVIGMSTA